MGWIVSIFEFTWSLYRVCCDGHARGNAQLALLLLVLGGGWNHLAGYELPSTIFSLKNVP